MTIRLSAWMRWINHPDDDQTIGARCCVEVIRMEHTCWGENADGELMYRSRPLQLGTLITWLGT